MLGTAFLLLNGLVILLLLYTTRRRNKNEPPLDKGFIPWLGHVLEFLKDAGKFLSRMKDKHGDIFTVRVAGIYVTMLLDPNSFDGVLNDDTNSFDFSNRRGQLLKKIFNLQLPGYYPASERKWMEQHFHGVNQQKLNASMNAHLSNVMLKSFESRSPSEWREDGLFELCYSLLFRAGYLTLFERRDDVDAVYEEFRKFDDLLTKLARGSLKREEKRVVATSQDRLWDLLSPGHVNGSWQQSYVQFLQEMGVDADMQKKAQLLQLWNTQCNAGPAAFWVLGFLLTHPEAMEAVKSEIRGLPSLQDTSLQRRPLNQLESQSTPVFDSVLSETLRLTAAVMINRKVVKDKILRMANGKEYHLRRGDRVCLFPFLSPQMDPQIHEEPQMFKYDRFLNEDKTVKKEFYKDEKKLKYFTMPWGAGKNICVGKEFAVTSIKQFVFLFLTHFDLELCSPSSKLPPVNPSRFGFGMLQPDGDLRVRFRLKTMQHEM
ncbi:prostacyclin synthase [Xiphophorus couchianus]|uniref:prostacyclin synthase n=1 Tax=Xiphophorus couchianus TaxID=32473 RepID=UPI001016F25E|nr:prostacyclin synthase-like [Xiphophorus couchianus]